MERATITEVARRAGVSISTASRALNGRVASAETAERVRGVATELGYVADSTARSLKLGKTQQLAFAVADIGNPVYVEIMGAVEAVVAAAGYRLTISTTGDADATLELVRSLGRGYVDGMILSPLRVTPELVEALAQSPVPVVVLGRLPEGSGIDTVIADSPTGMRLVVDHLVASGRRHLAFLNGPADTTPGRVRREAFERAVTHAGVSHEEIPVDDFTIAAGYRAARALLERPDRVVDALVAANDLIGIGALHAADDLGLRVPNDIAVTGMDDTELAQVTRPTLTSVDLGAPERGRAAARLLLSRLDEPRRPAETITVAPDLRVRRSSGG